MQPIVAQGNRHLEDLCLEACPFLWRCGVVEFRCSGSRGRAMVTWAASKTFLLGVSGFRPEEELTPGAYATGSLKDFIIPSKHPTGAYATSLRY